MGLWETFFKQMAKWDVNHPWERPLRWDVNVKSAPICKCNKYVNMIVCAYNLEQWCSCNVIPVSSVSIGRYRNERRGKSELARGTSRRGGWEWRTGSSPITNTEVRKEPRVHGTFKKAGCACALALIRFSGCGIHVWVNMKIFIWRRYVSIFHHVQLCRLER